jgi:hypothetical protein
LGYPNTIKFIDNVEKERISFTLKGYQSVRRIQKRMKRRYKKAKAIIIQRGCHNWIWKPLCNDGTVGIRPRLDTEALGLNFM